MSHFRIKFVLSLFALTTAVTPHLSVAAHIELAPIIKEGTPGEVLLDDPILPSLSGRTESSSGSGSVVKSVEDRTALPVNETGNPGTFTQFRGLGLSAEDIDVEAFGVPLNSPQGGGFDFSSFPSYLFSDYQIQLGPSLAAFDPRGVAGTVSLKPWTATALRSEKLSWHFTDLITSSNLFEISAGTVNQARTVSAVAGYRTGDSKGSGFGLSSVFYRSQEQATQLRFHLLATDLDSLAPGSASRPSPQQRQVTARAIPVLQLDQKISDALILKSSLFYDLSYLRAEDPGVFASKDHVGQLGNENTLLYKEWKFGASFRRVTYDQLDASVPEEDLLNLQITRSVESGRLLFEPTLQSVSVNRFGTYPGASLGASYALERGTFAESARVFSRLSYSRKIPSFSARYYVAPFFTPNPDLLPEVDLTAIAGFELKDRFWNGTFQAFFQSRQDAILFNQTSNVNSGNARVASLVTSVGLQPLPILDLMNALTLSSSQVDATSREVPYLPTILNTLRMTFRPTDYLSAGLSSRWSSSVFPGGGADIPGYGLYDLFSEYHLDGEGQGLSLAAKVENLFDRPVELIKDFPLRGRVYSAFFSVAL